MPEWSAQFYPWAHLVGRVLFSLVVVAYGMMHLANPKDVAGYGGSTRGSPPAFATAGIGVMIVIGGVLVALGWHRFIGAGLLAIFLTVVAFWMHAFWREQDSQVRVNEMAHFLKNLALAGAALVIAYYAGWDWPFALGG